MASSALPTTATAVPAFVTPIIEAYTTAIGPSMTFIMVMTVFASMLIPLLICLFYFSNTRMRRNPMFILVVLVIIIGLVLGIWNAQIEINAILSPFQPAAQSSVAAFQVIYCLTPWIVDLVLLFRLHAVYPYRTTRKPVFWVIFAFPVAIKIVRLVASILFAVRFSREVVSTGSAVIAAQKTVRSVYTKVEWTAQIADNGYVTALFLSKLRYAAFRGNDIGRESDASAGSFTSRLQTLFTIALTNFLFPLIFNLVQLIVIFTEGDFFVSSYIMGVNIYISIIGVVFATVWSSISTSVADNSPRTAQRSQYSNRLVFKNQRPSDSTAAATCTSWERSKNASGHADSSLQWNSDGTSGEVYSLPAIGPGEIKSTQIQ